MPQLAVYFLGLGIRTPAAAKRATLQEDQGTNPWSIMNGVMLDIED
jgi:hypothetical protein